MTPDLEKRLDDIADAMETEVMLNFQFLAERDRSFAAMCVMYAVAAKLAAQDETIAPHFEYLIRSTLKKMGKE